MIHPATRVVQVSHEIGQGVVATSPIPIGTIVWTQDARDKVIPRRESQRLSAEVQAHLEHFAHIDEYGNYVLCWDDGKLINHSCDPTLRGVGTWFQVARRDIQAGEEITCDYAECNITEELSCRCALPGCRGKVRADHLLAFAEDWDREATSLAALLDQVDQPLWPFLLDQDQAEGFLAKTRQIPSFRQLYAGAL